MQRVAQHEVVLDLVVGIFSRCIRARSSSANGVGVVDDVPGNHGGEVDGGGVDGRGGVLLPPRHTHVRSARVLK